jgi:hypothetical protein
LNTVKAMAETAPGTEYYEEEVEVEVTDDEDDVETPGSVETPAPVTPNKAPGKVRISKDVKSLKMKTPEGAKSPEGTKPPSNSSLNPNKNPFPAFGAWTLETLRQIDIEFPVLTSTDETTNELTRSTQPEARYWKKALTFKYGNFTSDTIRFDTVYIPFHSGKGYGSSFVYLSLPGFASNEFANAGKRRAPTMTTEKSLVPDSNRWWKVANKVDSSFGVVDQTTKKFHSKSLETIFDGTQSGVTAAVVLKFFCKAATGDKESLKPTTTRTVAVEVVRGYITSADVPVQMPMRVSKQKPKVEPAATARDMATDSLMRRLGDIGL